MAFDCVYLRTPRGERFGPLRIEEVKQWTRERRVPLRSVLIDDATGESRFVEDFPEIASEFSFEFLGQRLPGNRPALAGLVLGIVSLPLILCYVLPGAGVGLLAMGYSIAGLVHSQRHKVLGGEKLAVAGALIASIPLIFGSIFLTEFVLRFL